MKIGHEPLDLADRRTAIRLAQQRVAGVGSIEHSDRGAANRSVVDRVGRVLGDRQIEHARSVGGGVREGEPDPCRGAQVEQTRRRLAGASAVERGSVDLEEDARRRTCPAVEELEATSHEDRALDAGVAAERFAQRRVEWSGVAELHRRTVPSELRDPAARRGRSGTEHVDLAAGSSDCSLEVGLGRLGKRRTIPDQRHVREDPTRPIDERRSRHVVLHHQQARAALDKARAGAHPLERVRTLDERRELRVFPRNDRCPLRRRRHASRPARGYLPGFAAAAGDHRGHRHRDHREHSDRGNRINESM
ncbi:MAG: hypothetical protein H0T89_10710 [Deltaproteobacteria bacterium]|nr:hypothetical protein [Deltaproteobacteria bacterium]MDQ3297689.1 hypothetical protein [Myxococcota bacterium]